MPFYCSGLIYAKRIKQKGLGVFARVDIEADTVIEEVPVLVLPEHELYGPDTTSLLANYVFRWREGEVALALGFGSLYNHSYTPNARCQDVTPKTKRFVAIRDIQADEEITFNYAGEPTAKDPVGFDVR